MKTFWCEFAFVGGTTERGVKVTCGEDGSITDVAVGVSQDGAAVLAGVVLPGFANTHSHAFHRALRGRTNARGSFWTWREEMYRIANRLDPETYLELATATYAEMVMAGFTAVGEFHYLHHQPDGTPYSNPNHMGEVLREAAKRAGIRLTLLDTCYLTGGIGQDAAARAGSIRRRRRRSLGGADVAVDCRREHQNRRRHPFGPGGPRRCDDDGGGGCRRPTAPCPSLRTTTGERRMPGGLRRHSQRIARQPRDPGSPAPPRFMRLTSSLPTSPFSLPRRRACAFARPLNATWEMESGKGLPSIRRECGSPSGPTNTSPSMPSKRCEASR